MRQLFRILQENATWVGMFLISFFCAGLFHVSIIFAQTGLPADMPSFEGFLDEAAVRTLSKHARETGFEENQEFQTACQAGLLRTVPDWLIEDHQAQIRVTEEEIQQFYEANRHLYQTSGWVDLKHIFFKVRDATSSAGSLSRANAAYKLLKQGEDFDSVEARYEQSDEGWGGDSSNNKPVRVDPAAVSPAIHKAIINLSPGSISPPVRTEHGYSILKVVDMNEAGPQSLSEVREEVREGLRKKKSKEAFTELTKKAREAFPVDYNLQVLVDPSIPDTSFALTSGDLELNAGQLREMYEMFSGQRIADSTGVTASFIARVLRSASLLNYARASGFLEHPEIREKVDMLEDSILANLYFDSYFQKRFQEPTDLDLKQTLEEALAAGLIREQQKTAGEALLVPFEFSPDDGPPERHKKRVRARMVLQEITEALKTGRAQIGDYPEFTRWESSNSEGRVPLAAVHDPLFDINTRGLPEGIWSEPVRVPNRGYAVFRVTERKAPSPPDIDEIRERLLTLYQSKEYDRIRDELLADLNKEEPQRP